MGIPKATVTWYFTAPSEYSLRTFNISFDPSCLATKSELFCQDNQSPYKLFIIIYLPLSLSPSHSSRGNPLSSFRDLHTPDRQTSVIRSGQSSRSSRQKLHQPRSKFRNNVVQITPIPTDHLATSTGTIDTTKASLRKALHHFYHRITA